MEDIALPASIRTFVAQSGGMTIYFPQIYLPQNYASAQKINQLIRQKTNGLIQRQYDAQSSSGEFGDMIGLFEMKVNERNILSISFKNYAIIDFAAHGLTFMDALNVNLQTGESYQLADLFQSASHYAQRLTTLVNRQIKERDLDVFEAGGIESISPDQGFYMVDQSLVLYFQQYEISPYYVGLPTFTIPIYEVEDILNEAGPLASLFGN